MSLRADQIAQYAEQGLLVIDPQIPEATLARARADLAGHFPVQAGPQKKRYRGASIYYNRIADAWRFSAAVREIAMAPAIHSALAVLYGRRPLPFQTLNFLRGTEQLAHSDTIHFNCEPRGFMCGVWVALEDIDMENGPLVYYPGSQRLPEIGLRDLEPDVTALMKRPPLWWPDLHRKIYRPYYEPFIAALIEQRALTPQYALVKRGQAVIWSANLLHGGSPQRDRERTRWSQVTHFYFENCRYFAPLRERIGLRGKPVRFWRWPRWIKLAGSKPKNSHPGPKPMQGGKT
ncbi:MAG: phytanoyl-CoA dioxygenase family protein [Panacagrimonas sp.]